MSYEPTCGHDGCGAGFACKKPTAAALEARVGELEKCHDSDHVRYITPPPAPPPDWSDTDCTGDEPPASGKRWTLDLRDDNLYTCTHDHTCKWGVEVAPVSELEAALAEIERLKRG